MLSHLQGGMPSPSAAALGKFGDVPVSLHTGTPNIAVPLYTTEGRTLALPITLKYHASGIRVEEVPGWVGLGWALEAGGVITRSMRGLPDENTHLAPEARGWFDKVVAFGDQVSPGSGLYGTFNAVMGDAQLRNACTIGLQGNATTAVAEGSWDGEPDMFYFSFAGRAGKFVGGYKNDPNENPRTLTFRTLPAQNLHITYEAAAYPADGSVYGCSGSGACRDLYDRYISKWTITDENGTRYVFAAPEFTRASYDTPNPARPGDTYASAWYLTEIISPSGDDVITLEYAAPEWITRKHRERREWVMGLEPQASSDPPGGRTTTITSHIRSLRLSKIVTARDEITFTASTRTDVAAAYKLDAIVVKNRSGATRRSFNLTYGYFASVGGSSDTRLKLTQVVPKGSDGTSLNPYTFAYNSTLLPGYTSTAVDHWGYYNGRLSNDNEPHSPLPDMTLTYQDLYPGSSSAWQQVVDGANRAPTTAVNTMAAATLEMITYPTKGTVRFVYEPHSYAMVRRTVQTNDQPAGGLRIAQMVRTDGKGNTFYEEYRYTYDSYLLDLYDDAPLIPYQIWSRERFKLANMSTGVLIQEPSYVYHHEDTQSDDYALVSDQSFFPLGAGSHITYQVVAVTRNGDGKFDIDQDSYAKEVHVFSTANGYLNVGEFAEMEYADPCFTGSDTYDEWHGTAHTSYDWLRGWPLTYVALDTDNRLVRKTEREYSFTGYETDGPRTVRYPAAQVKTFPGSYNTTQKVTFYEIISAFNPLSKTKNYHCEGGTCRLLKETQLIYTQDAPYQLTEQRETNTDQTKRTTTYTYAHTKYSGMGPDVAGGEHHRLAPVYATTVKEGSSTRAKTWATWVLNDGHWRPKANWVWAGDGSTTDTSAPADPSGTCALPGSEVHCTSENVTYDAYGQVTHHKDGRGNSTFLYYGSNTSNCSQTASPFNNTHLTCIQRGTLKTEYEYHAAYGTITSIQDPSGNQTSFSYDVHGRLQNVRNAAGELTQAYTYHLSSGSVATDPNYVQTTAHVDGSKTYRTTAYLDGLGRPFQKQQQDGSASLIDGQRYDEQGRLAQVWKPIRATNSSQAFYANYFTNAPLYYDGFPEAVTNGRPYVETQYCTDRLDRPCAILPEGVSDLQQSVRMAYSMAQVGSYWYHATETTDESGKKTRTYVDGFGQTKQTVAGYGTAEAATTTFAYDIMGNLTTTTAPEGQQTTYAYDARQHMRRKVSPDAGTTQYLYDYNGNLRFSQDANQAALGQVQFFRYDEHDRVTQTGVGTATFATLNPNASPALETIQGNWITVYQYDDKPATGTFPWTQFTSSFITGSSMTNLEGRLSATAHRSNGVWQLTLYSYDADGRMVNTYIETAGSPALHTTLTMTYDRQGARTQTQAQVGAQRVYHWYTYDNVGRLQDVHASLNATKPFTSDTWFSYRAAGMVNYRRFANHANIQHHYDARDRLLRIGTVSSTTTPFTASYSYYPNGNIQEAEFHQPGSPHPDDRYRYSHTYDALNRLTQADYSADPNNDGIYSPSANFDVEFITYSANGNIRTLYRRNDPFANGDYYEYVYTSGTNRLSTLRGGGALDTKATYSYDGNGNVTARAGLQALSAMTYDERNLLLGVTTGGNAYSYRYNADGQRYYESGPSAATYDVVASGQTLGRFTGSGALEHWNIVTPEGRVLGRISSSGARFYYHNDHLGSVRTVVNASGSTVARTDYYPFGLEMPGRSVAGGQESVERYTGHELDEETDLYYAGARYLDPVTARWLAVDPRAEWYPEMSPYNYAGNNPIVNYDPNGEFIGTILGAVIGCAVGAATGDGCTQGAISGAAAGAAADLVVFTAGTGAVALVAAGAVGGAVGSVVDQKLSGEKIDPLEVGISAGAGGILGGVAGKLAGPIGRGVGRVFGTRTSVQVGPLQSLGKASSSADDIIGSISKRIHPGKQGKHVVGHNNYTSGRSILDKNAQALLDDLHSGNVNSVQKINDSKTRVDFGKVIGRYVDPATGASVPTTKGVVINSKSGVHIVPARPN